MATAVYTRNVSPIGVSMGVAHNASMHGGAPTRIKEHCAKSQRARRPVVIDCANEVLQIEFAYGRLKELGRPGPHSYYNKRHTCQMGYNSDKRRTLTDKCNRALATFWVFLFSPFPHCLSRFISPGLHHRAID